MQRFKRHLIEKYGPLYIGWDLSREAGGGSGRCVQPAQVPVTAEPGGKFNTDVYGHGLALTFTLLDDAAGYRFARQIGGAYMCVINAHMALCDARLATHETGKVLP